MILRWASLLSEDFAQARFDFYGKVLSGATKQRDRWKRAVGVVDDSCGEEVGLEYVRLHFPESSKKYMQELVNNLINAYRESISHSSWLGEETKAKALEKLSKFEPNIGYTNHWVDYSALNIKEDAGLVENMREVYRFGFGKNTAKAGKPVDREEWQMTPQTVNAYYAPKIDGFTALQRFFLSYALVWRSKARNEIAEQLLQIDPHSPAECRTNGIARNVDLFYDAFSVKEGDEMWLDPVERVHIW